MKPVSSPSVNSSKDVASVLPPNTTKDNVGSNSVISQHSQLNQATFQPVTPIRANKFEELLRGHPNRSLVSHVISGFKQGFLFKYQGPRVSRETNNLKLAYQYRDKLWESLMKEVHLGQIISPFTTQPMTPLICSLFGMVEKKNSMDMHRVTHLSYPKGSSINAFIDPLDVETHYQTFEAAVNLMAKVGHGSFMVKEDFKSAFHNIPMAFTELNLFGVKVEGKYFIDCALPFGASILCKIFGDVASLIHWIVEKRAGHKFVHYLDDFSTIHRLKMVCSSIMSVFKLVCDQIGMPMSPDKSEGPTQVIEFLGLMIDTIEMVVRILRDKMWAMSRGSQKGCINASKEFQITGI